MAFLSSRRADAVCLGIACLASLLFFAHLMVGNCLYFEDLWSYYHWKLILRDMWREGRFIWWSPYEYAGLPTLGDMQKALFYPLTLPFYVMPICEAIATYTIVHFAISGCGAYVLARGLGLPAFAALAAALAYAFGFWPLCKMSVLPMIGGYAWMPWMLHGIRMLQSETTRRWIVLTAFFVGMVWLSGAPQVSYYATLAALLLILTGARLPLRRNAAILVALVGGFLLAAPQFIPAAMVAKQTLRARGMSYKFGTTYSLTTRMLWTAVAPFTFGVSDLRPGESRGPLWAAAVSAAGGDPRGTARTPPVSTPSGVPYKAPENIVWQGDWSWEEMCIYPGIAVWLLAFVAVLSSRRWLVGGLFAVAVLSLLLSLGSNAPFYRLFFEFVPGADEFRVPARLSMFFCASMAFLAGLGLEALLRAESGRVRTTAAGIALGAALLWVALRLSGPQPAVPLQAFADIAYIFLALSLLGVGMIAVQWRSAGAVLLLAAIFAELAFLGHGVARTVRGAEPLAAADALKRMAKFEGVHRVLVGTSDRIPGSTSFWTIDHRLQNVQGWNPIALAPYIEYLFFDSAGRFPSGSDEIESLVVTNYLFVVPHLRSPLLDLLGTRLVATIDPDGSEHVLENKQALPRWWWVAKAEVEKDGQKALGRVQRGEVDPRKVALLETPAAAEGGTATVKLKYYGLDRVTLEVDATKPGLLCTSELYERGWHAAVDYAPVPTIRAFHALLAVPVPAGKHDVRLTYHPPGLTLGLGLFVLGLAVLAGVVVAWPEEPDGTEKDPASPRGPSPEAA
ncbi:MAG: YfhO family protein [Armatimonadetes bacterium]|nr:YfhO family protein [Armatimonadota bacterium]